MRIIVKSLVFVLCSILLAMPVSALFGRVIHYKPYFPSTAESYHQVCFKQGGTTYNFLVDHTKANDWPCGGIEIEDDFIRLECISAFDGGNSGYVSCRGGTSCARYSFYSDKILGVHTNSREPSWDPVGLLINSITQSGITYSDYRDPAWFSGDVPIQYFAVNGGSCPPAFITSIEPSNGSTLTPFTEETMDLETDISAVCRYSNVSNLDFEDMALFENTGSTSHSFNFNVANKSNLSFYVKCIDEFGDINGQDYILSYNIAPHINFVSIPSNVTTNTIVPIVLNFSDPNGFASGCEVCIKLVNTGLPCTWTRQNVTTEYANNNTGNCTLLWNTGDYPRDDFYNFTFRISDSTGASGVIKSNKIMLDRAPPYFGEYSIVSPNPEAFFFDDGPSFPRIISFRFLPRDLSQSLKCLLYIDDKLNQTISNAREGDNNQLSITSRRELPIEYHNWSIDCTDELGFTSIKDVKYYSLHEGSNLTVEAIYPPDKYVLNTKSDATNVLFNCSASSNYDISNITFIINNSGNSSVILSTFLSGKSGHASWNINLTNGTYDWRCEAHDSSKRFTAYSNRTLTILRISNNNSLNISITYPINNSVVNSSSVLLNITTSKNASCNYSMISCSSFESTNQFEADSFIFPENSSNGSSSGGGGGGGGCGASTPKIMNVTDGENHLQTTNLNNGNYELRFDCTDIFDNSNEASVSFLVVTNIGEVEENISNITKPNITESSTIESTIQTFIQSFINKSNYTFLVVGDTAPAEDVIAISDIVAAWQFQPIEDCGFVDGEPVCVRRIEIGAVKLASEIEDVFNTNLLSVGRPHRNSINNLFLPVSLWPLEENTAIITRFVHNGTATLIMAGNTDSDTRKAAKVIAEFRDYDLNDTCFKVNTTNSSNLTLTNCNLSQILNDTMQLNINITDPINGSTITTNSIWLNVTTNENAVCNYSSSFIFCSSGSGSGNSGGCAGGGSLLIRMNITGGKGHLQNIDTSSQGNYTLSVYCSDEFNNSNSSAVKFSVNHTQNDLKNFSKINLTVFSPANNSLIFENSIWLNLSTSKFSKCEYSLDSAPFIDLQEAEDFEVILPPGIEVEGDAWKIGSASKKLELSEDLTTGWNSKIETLRNITTFIDKNNLQALASGSVTNNKVTSPYNQYLYLLGPGVERSLDSGFVLYTENSDDDTTSDFLFFKSNREMFRYLLEFKTPFESDVDDSSGSTSTTGLFLTDYQDVNIKLLGKTYTIVTAKRTSTDGNNVNLMLMSGVAKDTLWEKQTRTYKINEKEYEITLNFVDNDEAQFVANGQATRKMKEGDTDKLSDGTIIGVTDILYQDYAGGIHSATFFIGAEKIELKDTNIKDVASSNNLKVNDNSIDDAYVIIEGSDDNSTFKINRIHVNMSADDDYFVRAGGKLSDAIEDAGGSSAEPEVLFTQSWDVEYKGLSLESTELVKITTSGPSQYNLEFLDGAGQKVSVPIAKAIGGSSLLFGEENKALINKENRTISKDDYIVLSDTAEIHRRGERATYVLQYKGADKETADNPVLKFKNLGDGKTVEQTYSSGPLTDIIGPNGNQITELATLKIGGSDFKAYAIDGTDFNDFPILIDLDANDAISSGNLNSTPVPITTKNGMEINITNETVSGDTSDIVFVTFRIPDDSRDGNARDSVESLKPTVVRLNITADSGKVRFALDTTTESQRLNFRTPDGETNVAYAYDSYGDFYKHETPTSDPAEMTIEVPAKQKVPLVYITSKDVKFIEFDSRQSALLTNISAGLHNLQVKCRDSSSDTAKFLTIFVLGIDTDNDTILDGIDNCINAPNTNQLDLDQDKIGDLCDDDDDNDGVNDSEDMLFGNSSNVNTTSINPVIEIENSTDLNQKFNETHSIKIKNNNKTIVEFAFNFSNNSLDLRNISIDIQYNASNGMTIINVKGLPIIGTKTLYVDNMNNLTTLCIKDAEITSITQISSLCNGQNEFGISCPGTANSGKYNCTFADESNTTFKIIGLTHSGIQQQSYCGDGVVNSGESCSNCPSDAGNCPSSGGGSSGGGSGGGGTAGFVCNMEWECSGWSECINGQQTRECNFAQVAQHVRNTQCTLESEKPETLRDCEIKNEQSTNISEPKTTPQAVSSNQAANQTETENQQNGLEAITGGVIANLLNNPKTMKEIKIGGIVVFIVAIVVTGFYLYRKKFHIYRKKYSGKKTK